MRVSKFYGVISSHSSVSQIDHFYDIIEECGIWFKEGDQLESLPRMAEFLTIVRSKKHISRIGSLRECD